MKFKKLGKRTVKTGIAVTITLFVSYLLDIESPFFASIAAIIAIQSSIHGSLERGKSRMFATLIGAITAIIFAYFIPFSKNPIFIGIGVIIVIYTCLNLGFTTSLQLASMIFISIVLNQKEGNRLSYAFHRTIDTFLGLAIGTLVNYFLFPHKIARKVEKSFEDMFYELRFLLKLIVWNKEVDLETHKKDIEKLEKEYKLLKDDIKYTTEKMSFNFNLDSVFYLFEATYLHLSILSNIIGDHIIDHNNKKALEELFKKDIPLEDEDRIVKEIDIVFNYHLKKTLNALSSISYIFDLS